MDKSSRYTRRKDISKRKLRHRYYLHKRRYFRLLNSRNIKSKQKFLWNHWIKYVYTNTELKTGTIRLKLSIQYNLHALHYELTADGQLLPLSPEYKPVKASVLRKRNLINLVIDKGLGRAFITPHNYKIYEKMCTQDHHTVPRTLPSIPVKHIIPKAHKDGFAYRQLVLNHSNIWRNREEVLKQCVNEILSKHAGVTCHLRLDRHYVYKKVMSWNWKGKKPKTYDIVGFYDNIDRTYIIKSIDHLPNLSQEEKTLVTQYIKQLYDDYQFRFKGQVCTTKKAIPQGGCSSTQIALLLLLPVELHYKLHIKQYHRYVDDIISTEDLSHFSRQLERIGLKLQQDNTNYLDVLYYLDDNGKPSSYHAYKLSWFDKLPYSHSRLSKYVPNTVKSALSYNKMVNTNYKHHVIFEDLVQKELIKKRYNCREIW